MTNSPTSVLNAKIIGFLLIALTLSIQSISVKAAIYSERNIDLADSLSAYTGEYAATLMEYTLSIAEKDRP